MMKSESSPKNNYAKINEQNWYIMKESVHLDNNLKGFSQLSEFPFLQRFLL